MHVQTELNNNTTRNTILSRAQSLEFWKQKEIVTNNFSSEYSQLCETNFDNNINQNKFLTQKPIGITPRQNQKNHQTQHKIVDKFDRENANINYDNNNNNNFTSQQQLNLILLNSRSQKSISELNCESNTIFLKSGSKFNNNFYIENSINEDSKFIIDKVNKNIDQKKYPSQLSQKARILVSTPMETFNYDRNIHSQSISENIVGNNALSNKECQVNQNFGFQNQFLEENIKLTETIPVIFAEQVNGIMAIENDLRYKQSFRNQSYFKEDQKSVKKYQCDSVRSIENQNSLANFCNTGTNYYYPSIDYINRECLDNNIQNLQKNNLLINTQNNGNSSKQISSSLFPHKILLQSQNLLLFKKSSEQRLINTQRSKSVANIGYCGKDNKIGHLDNLNIFNKNLFNIQNNINNNSAGNSDLDVKVISGKKEENNLFPYNSAFNSTEKLNFENLQCNQAKLKRVENCENVYDRFFTDNVEENQYSTNYSGKEIPENVNLEAQQRKILSIHHPDNMEYVINPEVSKILDNEKISRKTEYNTMKETDLLFLKDPQFSKLEGFKQKTYGSFSGLISPLNLLKQNSSFAEDHKEIQNIIHSDHPNSLIVDFNLQNKIKIIPSGQINQFKNELNYNLKSIQTENILNKHNDLIQQNCENLQFENNQNHFQKLGISIYNTIQDVCLNRKQTSFISDDIILVNRSKISDYNKHLELETLKKSQQNVSSKQQLLQIESDTQAEDEHSSLSKQQIGSLRKLINPIIQQRKIGNCYYYHNNDKNKNDKKLDNSNNSLNNSQFLTQNQNNNKLTQVLNFKDDNYNFNTVQKFGDFIVSNTNNCQCIESEPTVYTTLSLTDRLITTTSNQQLLLNQQQDLYVDEINIINRELDKNEIKNSQNQKIYKKDKLDDGYNNQASQLVKDDLKLIQERQVQILTEKICQKVIDSLLESRQKQIFDILENKNLCQIQKPTLQNMTENNFIINNNNQYENKQIQPPSPVTSYEESSPSLKEQFVWQNQVQNLNTRLEDRSREVSYFGDTPIIATHTKQQELKAQSVNDKNQTILQVNYQQNIVEFPEIMHNSPRNNQNISEQNYAFNNSRNNSENDINFNQQDQNRNQSEIHQNQYRQQNIIELPLYFQNLKRDIPIFSENCQKYSISTTTPSEIALQEIFLEKYNNGRVYTDHQISQCKNKKLTSANCFKLNLSPIDKISESNNLLDTWKSQKFSENGKGHQSDDKKINQFSLEKKEKIQMETSSDQKQRLFERIKHNNQDYSEEDSFLHRIGKQKQNIRPNSRIASYSVVVGQQNQLTEKIDENPPLRSAKIKLTQFESKNLLQRLYENGLKNLTKKEKKRVEKLKFQEAESKRLANMHHTKQTSNINELGKEQFFVNNEKFYLLQNPPSIYTTDDNKKQITSYKFINEGILHRSKSTRNHSSEFPIQIMEFKFPNSRRNSSFKYAKTDFCDNINNEFNFKRNYSSKTKKQLSNDKYKSLTQEKEIYSCSRIRNQQINENHNQSMERFLKTYNQQFLEGLKIKQNQELIIPTDRFYRIEKSQQKYSTHYPYFRRQSEHTSDEQNFQFYELLDYQN